MLRRRDLPILPLKSALCSPNVSQPHVIRCTCTPKRRKTKRKRAKAATKRSTGMITDVDFTTHPLIHLRSYSHHYGTLGDGVPGVSKLSREEALPAFCFSELSLASPVDGFTLAVPIWY